MSVLKVCHLLAAFVMVAAFAAGQVTAADQAGPADETDRYIEKYAQFVGLLQESKFDYAGTKTRSTPTKALAGQWQLAGTLRVSAARRSFHLTSTCELQFPKREEIGGNEDLATPKRYLEVFIPNARHLARPGWHYGVTTLPQVRGDEWIKRVEEHELGALLGYKQLGGEEKSLLEICRSGPREFLSDVVVNGKHLKGFVAKSDALEVRALFDPANDDQFTKLRVSRRSDKSPPMATEPESAAISIQELKFTGGKPSSMKVKSTMTYAGGSYEGPLTRNQLTPSKPVKREFEHQTWEQNYELNHFEYEPQDAWFALETAIPNGTPVQVEGLPGSPFFVGQSDVIIDGTKVTVTSSLDLELYWKDGRLTPFPIK